MNKREDILADALLKIETDTERWKQYKEDHKFATENLNAFSKKLEVDIMVPIGTKAMMAGTLCHTNEVFISHYASMFSKCTAYQAKEICKHRIKVAQNQLDKLKSESDFFNNQLEIPHLDGAVANKNEQEIIEEYNEEDEKIWREKHRENVRKAKHAEKTDKENETVATESHEDLMKKLDELELIDELEQELEELDIRDDDALEKLIKSEININEKKRVSHLNKNLSSVVVAGEVTTNDTNSSVKEHQHSVVNDLEKKYNDEVMEMDEDSDSSSTSDYPIEIAEMEETVKDLPVLQQFKFYKKELKKITADIQSLKITNPIELENKLHKIEIRDYLLDLNSILEDQIEEDSISEEKTSKKIKFALKDEIKYIDNTVSVENMFKNEVKRDVIKLDPEFGLTSPLNKEVVKPEIPKIDKKAALLEKVDKNIKFVQETQSKDDFDLVGKILGIDKTESKTLSINFAHSDNCNEDPIELEEPKQIIGSPSDIYKLFSRNKEAEIDEISKNYVPKKEMPKTILKNKESVQLQIPNKLPPEEPKYTDREDYDYETIVGDVKENIITEPEPLPETKFIDTHMPKKRISRFKQSRNNKSN